MLQNTTGKFFHIDFGHFLDHYKVMLGVKRDREPFILSNELRFFLGHFYEIKVEIDEQGQKKQRTENQKKIGRSKSVDFSNVLGGGNLLSNNPNKKKVL